MNSELEQRRAAEKAKYVFLASMESNTYGNGLFGKKALPIIQQLAPQSLVDLGCGQNLFCGLLRQSLPHCKTVGVDWAFPQADVCAPMYDTGLPDSAFEVVTSFDALEHLLPEDVPVTFKEMQRIAVPGAYFVFSICTKPSVRNVKGERLHPTVRSLGWWLAQLADVVRSAHELDGFVVGTFKED